MRVWKESQELKGKQAKRMEMKKIKGLCLVLGLSPAA